MKFKRLTLANWAQADPANSAFGRLSPENGLRRATGDDWAQMFLSVELGDHVPEDVTDLFAVARGTMVYGWFFYPLFALGEEQLHRVLEAAAKARYRELEGPSAKPSFTNAIDWLIGRGVIASDDEERWKAARDLRNEGSHPTFQSLLPPGAVMVLLRTAADDIDGLFTTDVDPDRVRPPRSS